MDLFDFLDRILPGESSTFVCPSCKNDQIVLTLHCPCKEDMIFCFGCVMIPENFVKLREELSAHTRKCNEAGRVVAISAYLDKDRHA